MSQDREYTFQELATKRRQLALEYKTKMARLAELKKNKALKLIELMAEHKTKAKAEIYYDATPEGQESIEIEYYCRGLLELMRSIKTECDIKQSEAYNQY